MTAAATIVIASSGAPVAVQAAAMLVLVGVLAVSIAFLVRRARQRSRVRHDRYQQAITELPPEYQPDFRHRSLWVTGYLVISGAVALVGNLVSGEAALVLACMATLTRLLDNLVEVYGADMQPLRSLLPAGADNYRA